MVSVLLVRLMESLLLLLDLLLLLPLDLLLVLLHLLPTHLLHVHVPHLLLLVDRQKRLHALINARRVTVHVELPSAAVLRHASRARRTMKVVPGVAVAADSSGT